MFFPEKFYTPPQAASVLGVKPDKVVAWINSGELVGYNLAISADGERPRWRVTEEDLGKFLLRRRNCVVVAAAEERARRMNERDAAAV